MNITLPEIGPRNIQAGNETTNTISPALRGLQLLVAPAWSRYGKIRGSYFSVSTTFFQV
jgi:hypothetical protein